MSDPNGTTNLTKLQQLFSAIDNSDFHTINTLITENSNLLELANTLGQTPIGYAITKAKSIKIAIAQATLFHHIACHPLEEHDQDQTLRMIEILRANSISVTEVYNHQRMNVLQCAVYYNRLDVIRHLIENGIVSINYQGTNDRATMLHYAADFDAVEIAAYLLEQGAATHLVDYNSNKAIECATRTNLQKLINAHEQARRKLTS